MRHRHNWVRTAQASPGPVRFVLYRPVEALARAFPGVKPVLNLDDALTLMQAAYRQVEENGAGPT